MWTNGELAKRTKLNDSGQCSIDCFQAIERVIQREDGHLARGGYLFGFVDCHTAHTVARLVAR